MKGENEVRFCSFEKNFPSNRSRMRGLKSKQYIPIRKYIDVSTWRLFVTSQVTIVETIFEFHQLKTVRVEFGRNIVITLIQEGICIVLGVSTSMRFIAYAHCKAIDRNDRKHTRYFNQPFHDVIVCKILIRCYRHPNIILMEWGRNYQLLTRSPISVGFETISIRNSVLI